MSRRLSYGERQIRAMVEALRRGESVFIEPTGDGHRAAAKASQRSLCLQEARRRIAASTRLNNGGYYTA